MSDLLPSPPDPRDNRAFRDWLYKVYRLLNGNDGEIAGQADMSAGSSASASAAANQALILANDSVLMQMRQVISQQSGELSVMRAQVGEMQKQIDGLMLSGSQPHRSELADAVLLAGVRN